MATQRLKLDKSQAPIDLTDATDGLGLTVGQAYTVQILGNALSIAEADSVPARHDPALSVRASVDPTNFLEVTPDGTNKPYVWTEGDTVLNVTEAD